MNEAMKTDTYTEVLGAICSGELDEKLDALSGMIRERRRLVRQSKARMTVLTTTVGDTGVLKGLSPQHINGVRVRVTKINRTKLVVEPVEPMKLPGRTAKKLGVYRYGDGENCTCHGVTVPASCFEAD